MKIKIFTYISDKIEDKIRNQSNATGVPMSKIYEDLIIKGMGKTDIAVERNFVTMKEKHTLMIYGAKLSFSGTAKLGEWLNSLTDEQSKAINPFVRDWIKSAYYEDQKKENFKRTMSGNAYRPPVTEL